MAEVILQLLFQSLLDIVNDISMYREYIKSHRKESVSLARRIKLLGPLFEEVRDLKEPLPEGALASFQALKSALEFSKQLLLQCHSGSKLYLVLEGEAVSSAFCSAVVNLGQALDELPYNSLFLSDEVHEQVVLVHSQLRRAKGRQSSLDSQLSEDAVTVLGGNRDSCKLALERLAGKLRLRTMSELQQESQALQAMFAGTKRDENIDKVYALLGKLQELALSKNPEAAMVETPEAPAEKPAPPAIPEDFQCPISLELMKDPVIVATGQTYERASIQKWLDAGHKTCPKTRQPLTHLVLTPNYVLRSLIAHWCETHGLEPPKGYGSSRPSGKLSSSHGIDVPHATDLVVVEALVQRLATGQLEEKRAAAGELRLLAKRSIENRISIAEAGGIPLLVELLSTQDKRTQEHAVTALLNLSIHDQNKGLIVLAGAIEPIVEVLRGGSMEARENAAATLFSLSVADENKVTIGASGAIPTLVDLFNSGSLRGKKDAATALFNLSIYQGNKARAVRAGIVPALMRELLDTRAGMVDESLAILAILVTHHEGRVAVGNESPVPVLVELISSGSARTKENAAAVLLALCSNDSAHVVAAHQLGAYLPLAELAVNGTMRARRKAGSLLEHLCKQDEMAEVDNVL
ncbi:U-box domain-containing protein 13 [Selaginella moellendorffii]|uniref:U-box domain-containing protein 13 n=1 Tax=Selaginella moellendorffii TaxID=88036 RepID=UPI000D1CC578|nr:U-box domain-containing protein 13 [Selaginella moellendorffii]XP_024519573.1 U-box domain-containing protein 13 [Selaginella moellendorffii]XP_024529523.1 U-box domain-containing protein 13 [Selaginella moellendorffii]XP_024529524.1 U-box domain-containing protein 13 [Selaginella moellendorffii]XP_024529525.1 U-box domain-containing protein 13 [Selaginella moellendorffii]|eukprot:XP_024519572.1 U-box domain-containing protein 13 [Selaginella moellendorffii]